MTEPITTPRIVVSTARGGHIADPAAKCPYCGQPVGVHRVINIEPLDGWFPIRAVLCDTKGPVEA